MGKECDTCTNTIPEDADNQTICQECIDFEFRYKSKPYSGLTKKSKPSKHQCGLVPKKTKEERAAQNKEYRSRPEVKERMRAQDRKRQEKHNARHKTEEGKAKRKAYRETEKAKEIHRKYKTSLKGKLTNRKNAGIRKQRLKNMKLEGDLTVEQWQDIMAQHNYSCAYCNVRFSELIPATIDHVIPMIKGGRHSADNVVPACRSCNSSKGAKPLEEFKKVSQS